MSNNVYTPDRWVLLELIDQETGTSVTKVFGGWGGGYLNGDSWKLSSGVVEVEDRDDYWEFINVSGSVYRCRKVSQGMTGYMTQVYHGWVKDTETSGKFTIGILNQ